MAEDGNPEESDEYEDDLEEDIVADEESEEEGGAGDDHKESSQRASGTASSSPSKTLDEASGVELDVDAFDAQTAEAKPSPSSAGELPTFEEDEEEEEEEEENEEEEEEKVATEKVATEEGELAADTQQQQQQQLPPSHLAPASLQFQAVSQDDLLDMASELRRGFTDSELVCLRPILSTWDHQSKEQLVSLLSDPPLSSDFQEKIAQALFGYSDWLMLEAAIAPSSTGRASPAEETAPQAGLQRGSEEQPASTRAGDGEAETSETSVDHRHEEKKDEVEEKGSVNYHEEHEAFEAQDNDSEVGERAEPLLLQQEAYEQGTPESVDGHYIPSTETAEDDAEAGERLQDESLSRGESAEDKHESSMEDQPVAGNEDACGAAHEASAFDMAKPQSEGAAVSSNEEEEEEEEEEAELGVVADQQLDAGAGQQEADEESVMSDAMWEAVAPTEASSAALDAPNSLDDLIHEAATGSLDDVSGSPRGLKSLDAALEAEGREGEEASPTNPEGRETEPEVPIPQVEAENDQADADADQEEDASEGSDIAEESEDEAESEVASDLSSEAARFQATDEEQRERLELSKMTSEEEAMKRHLQNQALWEQLTTGCSRSYLDQRLGTFEGKVEPEVLEAQLREQAKQNKERKANAQVEALLKLMAIKGGGNITLAWRRYFDSDGDGELSFGEFCAALMDLGYGKNQDLIVLWKDLTSRGDRPDADCITLEAIDPVGASILDSFGRWCKEAHDGPWELFRKLDEDGSDSLSAEEFIEGLNEYGFFDLDYLPPQVASEDLVLENLFPLLDSGGCGCVTADQLLFLELDKDKRERIKRELKKAREEGTAERDLAPLTNDAQEMLHNMVMSTTNLGGKHWTTVHSEVAVGGPWGLELSFGSSPRDTVSRAKHTAGSNTLSSHGPNCSGQLSRRQQRLNTGSSTMTTPDKSPRTGGAVAKKTSSTSDEALEAARTSCTFPSGLGQTSASMPTRTLPAKKPLGSADLPLAASQPLLPSSRPAKSRVMDAEGSTRVPPSPSPLNGGPRPNGFDEFVAKRTKELPPLQTSPHVLDHYKGWGNGGTRITYQKEGTLPKSASTSSLPPASRSPGNASNGFTSSSKQDARRKCYRRSLVPALLPTIRKDGAFGKTTSTQGADSKPDAPVFCATTGARFAGAGAGGMRVQSSKRAKEKLQFKPEICGHFLTSATAVGLFRHYGGDT